jgi:hypothetical protein
MSFRETGIKKNFREPQKIFNREIYTSTIPTTSTTRSTTTSMTAISTRPSVIALSKSVHMSNAFDLAANDLVAACYTAGASLKPEQQQNCKQFEDSVCKTVY